MAENPAKDTFRHQDTYSPYFIQRPTLQGESAVSMNISIKNLNKVYGRDIHALKEINLEIENGMFGLLGPNGAGKTTLMRILVTLLEPSEGTVKFGDLDFKKDRRSIRSMLGYLPQEFHTFSKLKTGEFLDYAAQLAGLRNSKERNKKVDEILESVGLYEARERQANKLSGGMKRRLGIAQALIGNPRILIIDEPTTGLDPEERLRFRNLLADMSQNDIIIILSTHIVGDISSSCGRMAMLNKGEMVYNGSPDKLIDQVRGHAWLIEAKDSELDQIKTNYTVISTVPSSNGWDVQVVSEKMDGFDGRQIEPTLEHAYVYFLEYTLGESFEEDVF